MTSRVDRHLQLVGELLQFDLPQACAHIVGAAAVRRDRQLTHIGIALASDPRDPGADRSDRELGGVVGDADADPAGIGGGIVDAVWNDLAFLLVLEVVQSQLVGRQGRLSRQDHYHVPDHTVVGLVLYPEPTE